MIPSAFKATFDREAQLSPIGTFKPYMRPPMSLEET